MAMNIRPPRSPELTPWWLAGLNSQPEYRGKTQAELEATLPVFGSWDEAIRSPYFAGKPDWYITNFLTDNYGLGGAKVQNGRLVSTDHSLRNGLLGGAAMMGGMFGLESLLGGGAAAAGGGTGAGAAGSVGPGSAAVLNGATGSVLPASTIPAANALLTTGATASPFMTGGAAAGSGLLAGTTIPAANALLTKGATAAPMTTMASALAGGAVPGATGALANAGGSALGNLGKTALDKLLSPQGILSLASLIPLLAGKSMQGGTAPTYTPSANDPNVAAMRTLAMSQANRADPLHQASVQLAWNMLPKSARQGVSPPPPVVR